MVRHVLHTGLNGSSVNMLLEMLRNRPGPHSETMRQKCQLEASGKWKVRRRLPVHMAPCVLYLSMGCVMQPLEAPVLASDVGLLPKASWL